MDDDVSAREPMGTMQGPRMISDRQVKLMAWRPPSPCILCGDIVHVEVVPDAGVTVCKIVMKRSDFATRRVCEGSSQDHVEVDVPARGTSLGERGRAVEVESDEVGVEDFSEAGGKRSSDLGHRFWRTGSFCDHRPPHFPKPLFQFRFPARENPLNGGAVVDEGRYHRSWHYAVSADDAGVLLEGVDL
jgi:hypothetical protein